MRDHYVYHQSVSIHYLDSRNEKVDTSLSPLVYFPGSMGIAETFQSEMKRLLPRRTISITFRGVGKSSAPLEGYTLENYIADAQAVITDTKLNRFTLMAYSAKVPLAIEYTARHPEQVNALILLDYPAHTRKITDDWVERVANHPHFSASKEILLAMQRESETRLLWDRLSLIKCPVLVLCGGKEGSLVSREDRERYREKLPHAQIVCFEDSGHDLWNPDYERFMKTIEEFLFAQD
jgi:pimeloyl-ACP methyl ester carboxylesterase